MEYILPIGIFIVFGIVFGVLLTVISKSLPSKSMNEHKKSPKPCQVQTVVHAAMPAVRTMRMPS